MVAYDEGGCPVLWGKDCVDLPPPIKIHECFKYSMVECLPNTNPEPHPVIARDSPQRWMQDYIHLLFGHIVAKIDSKLDPYWKDATIHWISPVPGSWAEFPTVADSKGLAADAVHLCIGDRKASRIIINTNQGVLSCSSFLVARRDPKSFPEGRECLCF